MKNFRFLVLLLALNYNSAADAQTWDLATDFTLANHGSSPWLLGMYTNGTEFTQFTVTNQYSSGWFDDKNNGVIMLNTSDSYSYGILPHNVSLDSDNETPVARWVAPATSFYKINVVIGGSFENHNVHLAGLKINGLDQEPTTINSDTNTKSWTLNYVKLNQGDWVDAYVGQNYGWGNTNTVFTITDNSVVTVDNC